MEKVWDMARYVVAFEQWVRDEKIAFVASHYDGFAKGVAGKLDSMLIPAFSMLIKRGHGLRRRGRHQGRDGHVHPQDHCGLRPAERDVLHRLQ